MRSRGSTARRKAVLLGASHGAIALARSLRAAGMDVWLITDETSTACFSSAVSRVLRWNGANDARSVEALEAIAREHSLAGSILVPAADPEVQLAAAARERLSPFFEVMLPDWEDLRWACDKALAYRRAEELGLGVPHVYDPSALTGAALAQLQYPIVLKPSMRLHRNRFTADRAWRIDDRESFIERYAAACELVGAEHVVAQQMIPGGGENQLSYAGLWNRGQPVIGLTARRLRQYPVEFGQTSTFVETAHLPEVTAAAETFLRSVRHHGLVEIEFKRDERDGILKLLDVNPRPWNWLGLAARAGIDFGAAIACVVSGQPVPKMNARPGVAWIFASRDIVAAARSGRLRPREVLGYAATWTHVRSFACFSWTDPSPAVVDFPLTLMRMLQRREPQDLRRAQP